MWSKQQPPKAQITREELESYLRANPFTPIYIATKSDRIVNRIVFDNSRFVGLDYLKPDDDGNPLEVKIPPTKYPKYLSKISEEHLLYTLHGIKLTLDKLDKEDRNSK